MNENIIPPEVEANIAAMEEFTKNIKIVPYYELSDEITGPKEKPCQVI